MNELRKDFSIRETMYWKILMGTFIANLLLTILLFILQGEVPILLAVFPVIIGFYHVVSFFVYIYRTYTYYNSKDHEGIAIWRSITGVALSPVGLAFSFFNYIIIVLANVW